MSPVEHIDKMVQEYPLASNVLTELRRRIVEDNSYRVHFSTLHINIVRKVFRWCVDHKTHIIHKSDIQDLTHTDYGNFYILQRFGLLYYMESSEGDRIK